ncbi:hypothetical protein Nocox_07695 [Nonomuraea coxensis DSM 45129]|uniref:Antitoxin VbhA domain-containing protein n=1 Tax=Nonomuraea coxensis DSM 45129 TaxID=1122611 RepID=A0ABX8TXB1_9ACTN|nr:hypothetical protein [Nonomuraea coxensis]QYC39164.1 hypothetical protein Nocox_07695 [Nonomuraea coxensis DSM 45129]
MKITLDTTFNGSLGQVTLSQAVQRLRERDLACTVPADAVDRKVTVFTDCVKRGFTPLRSEIMAAYYVAERDAAIEAFDRGLITQSELESRQAQLVRLLINGS